MNRFAGVAILASIAIGTPAAADVKVGVDAWRKGDYKGAVEQWRPDAIAGDPDAQFNLGQAYKLGRGVPVDITMAQEWYRKAALQGHLQAGDNYGLALFQGGRQAEAVPWLEKSVARAEPRAEYVYATMLFNGDAGVTKDYVRAYALMTRASNAGLPQASQALSQMDGYVGLADRQAGVELARQYEAQAATASLPSDVAGGDGGMHGVELPPSNTSGESGGTITAPPPPRPVRTRPAPQPRPEPVEVASEAPARPVATGGRWRVQFGAFRDEGNAKGLWQSLKGRVGALSGLQPYYSKSGTLTKVQAGPLASSGDAARVCAAVKPTGTPCVPVAP